MFKSLLDKGALPVLVLLLVLTLTFQAIEGRRFGGGFRSGGTRTRSSFGGSRRSGTNFFGGGRSRSYNLRNPGYGTYRARRTPMPRTSLYTRNYGRYPFTRASSSYNGFGLGLGSGLLLGYSTGLLARPIGYGASGFGYNYIHAHRNYRVSQPLRCSVANVSEYLKPKDILQEINIDEGEKICPYESDSCYGTLAVKAVNFTDQDNNTFEGFEVRIEKDCAIRADIKLDSATYDSTRQCWIGTVKSDIINDLDEDTLSDLNIQTLARALDVENKTLDSIELMQQFETCVCKGWYCNGKSILTSSKPLFLLIIASFIALHECNFSEIL